MKRWSAGAVALIIAGLVMLGIFWAAAATVLQHFFGFNPGSGNGSHYLFFSGSGSDLAYLGAATGAITSAVVLYKHHNCHEPGCWRIGRVRIDDKGTLSCWHHHPEGRPQPGHVCRAHESYQQRLHLYLGKHPGDG